MLIVFCDGRSRVVREGRSLFVRAIAFVKASARYLHFVNGRRSRRAMV
ncbi:MAG TPA: hypothetical protein V6C58_12000 [Allocoleopsis sp.]